MITPTCNDCAAVGRCWRHATIFVGAEISMPLPPNVVPMVRDLMAAQLLRGIR